MNKHSETTHLHIPFFLNAGTPESAVIATVGKFCLDTDTGDFYYKVSGSGNTGWEVCGTIGIPVDGNSRLINSGDDVLLQKRVSGSWVTIRTFEG